MSDAAEYLAAHPDEAKVCADSEFIQRDDGLPGVSAAYGMKLEVVEVTIDLLYPQIGKSCTIGVVSTTDARIKSNDLVALEDDKKFFVPYNAAFTVRAEIAEANPDLAKMFAEIAEELDNETMIELNGKVDIDGEKEADVARQWLADEGFID